MAVGGVYRLFLTDADGRQVTDPLPAVDLADAIRLSALVFHSDPGIVRLILSDLRGDERHTLDR
ncbi:hypothetical protein [Brevundimonas sp. GCM10030266]|uniref:hypothetical protein n=1 Tax=Brevundimonas sp. GCM10030266 TaxID=3273386 RepID=UPI0036216D9D